MIVDAWNCFLQHPFWGIGVNNFRYYAYAQTYSHNTYVELLASSGIIGTLPFIVFFTKGVLPIIKTRFDTTSASLYRQKLAVFMLIALLFIAGGQIIFYQTNLMLGLGVLVSCGVVFQDEKMQEKERKIYLQERRQ